MFRDNATTLKEILAEPLNIVAETQTSLAGSHNLTVHLTNNLHQTDWKLHHKGYYEDVLPMKADAGGAFLHCREKTEADLHKGIHDVSKVLPLTPDKRTDIEQRYYFGACTQSKQQGHANNLAACQDNKFRNTYHLDRLVGLVYDSANISGAPMAASVADSHARVERIVFNDFAFTSTGAQKDLDSCRKFIIMQANACMEGLDFELPTNKLYLTSKTSHSLSAKPTVNATLAPALLAEYDAASSPMAQLTVRDKHGNAVKGAPSAALYLDSKVPDNQKVTVTAFLEGTEDSDTPTAARLKGYHHKFMNGAFEYLRCLYMESGKYTPAAYMHLNSNCMSNPTAALLTWTHMQDMSKIITYKSQAGNALCNALCRLATHATTAQAIRSHTDNGRHVSAGESEAVAANLALIHPALQVLEFTHIWPSQGKACFVIATATAQAADILSRASSLSFGIQGEFSVYLSIDSPKSNRSLDYSIVSSPLNVASYTAVSLNKHLHQMLPLAMEQAHKLWEKRAISTPVEDVGIYLIDDNDQVVNAASIDKAIVSTIVHTPRQPQIHA